jgi:hypothetical protein
MKTLTQNPNPVTQEQEASLVAFIEPDHDCSPPWVEYDGHGHLRCVSVWQGSLAKKPGEVVLYRDRHVCWLYDVAESINTARADGWGLSDTARQNLEQRLGRLPTQREVTAEAVQQDVKFCSRYLDGLVCWFTVACWPAGDDSEKSYVGGVLCEHGDSYLEDTAKVLAQEFISSKRFPA